MSEERTQLWGLKILIEAVRVASQQNIYTPESIELIKEAVNLFVQPVSQEEPGQSDVTEQSDTNDAAAVENEASDTPTSDESADTEE